MAGLSGDDVALLQRSPPLRGAQVVRALAPCGASFRRSISSKRTARWPPPPPRDRRTPSQPVQVVVSEPLAAEETTTRAPRTKAQGLPGGSSGCLRASATSSCREQSAPPFCKSKRLIVLRDAPDLTVRDRDLLVSTVGAVPAHVRRNDGCPMLAFTPGRALPRVHVGPARRGARATPSVMPRLAPSA